ELFQYNKEQPVSEATCCNLLSGNDDGFMPEMNVVVERVDAFFEGSSEEMKIEAAAQSTDYRIYYHGNNSQAATKVHHYKKIFYRSIYPNIDLIFTVPGESSESL